MMKGIKDIDEVSIFLQTIGLIPEPHYFLRHRVFIGMAVETPHFQLIYRQQAERLLLCELKANQRDGQALQKLIALLRQIIQAVPALRYLDARFLPAPNNPLLSQTRQRLAEFMLAQGANRVTLADGEWLRWHNPDYHLAY